MLFSLKRRRLCHTVLAALRGAYGFAPAARRQPVFPAGRRQLFNAGACACTPSLPRHGGSGRRGVIPAPDARAPHSDRQRNGPAGRLQSVPGIVASLSPEQGYFQSIPEGPQGIAPDIAQHFMPRSGRVFCGWRYPDGRPRIPRPAGSTSEHFATESACQSGPCALSRGFHA